MDTYYWLYAFLEIISFGYICFTPILLFAFAFFRRYRSKIVDWIAISNGWFSLSNLIWITQLGIELFTAWYSQNNYEGYSFYYSRSNIFSPYGFVFWLRILLIPASMLSLFRKFRRSIWFTLALIFGLLITSEWFATFITSFYRDYLPSSWSRLHPKEWWENDVVYLSWYLIIVALTYFIQKKITTHIKSSSP